VVLQLGAAQLSGRFDRVDMRKDESGTRRVVVDYKTSRPKHHDVVQRDLQVRAYAVALSRREHADSARVELHYLQTGEVTAVDFDRAFLSRAEYQLGAVTDELVQAWASGTFPARPSRWQCGHCEYRTVCDESRGS
jgi:CRISPR/Cas system-associated exonuclease Cas4 (RecB family)